VRFNAATLTGVRRIRPPAQERTQRAGSSVRGRWFGTVAEPAKEPESAFAEAPAAEQSDRDHREHQHNFGDSDDLTEQRVEHSDTQGSAQRGSAGNSGPPGHPFARAKTVVVVQSDDLAAWVGSFAGLAGVARCWSPHLTSRSTREVAWCQEGIPCRAELAFRPVPG
jgi:hypothetical protein